MEKPRYTHEIEIKVRDYECDMQGIVNNANYQHYMEHARHEFLLSAGKGFTDLRELGIECVVRRVEIEYRVSLRSKDIAVCRLYMRREGPKYVFYQDIYRKSDDKLHPGQGGECRHRQRPRDPRRRIGRIFQRLLDIIDRATLSRPTICHRPFPDERHDPASRRMPVASMRRHRAAV